ncbi:hypothetical protein RJ639_003644, partial [Escallonia herrerae]
MKFNPGNIAFRIFYYPRLRYISKLRDFYRSGCYSRIISRSRFTNYYRLFIGRMERIGGKKGPQEMSGKIEKPMELAKHFIRTNIESEWMVFCLLPVLPLELRPIIQIDGGKLMSSDINELYRRVIYRNNTLTDLLTTSKSTPGELVMCQEKLVQEVVDTLLDNGIRGQSMRDGHNKVYKSFSD